MRVTASLGAIALAAALGAGGVHAQQDFSWNGAVDRGDAVEIRGINGDITARPASGGEVRLRASKSADDSDLSSVRIEVVEDSEGVLICAVYPTPRGKEENRCARGRDYRMNNSDNDVVVDFTVEIPDGVELEAVSVNGDVTVTGLSAAVDAVTVNGDVEVDTRGTASATTVNGSIDARVGSVSDDLSFTTVNGSIRVTLPANVGADIEATTVNGSIETDFPITIRGRWGPRTARGEIGGGGVELELTTVNGSIELRRAG